MAKNTNDKPVEERTVKTRALTQEVGRRRLNNERVAKGEDKVRTRSWFLRSLNAKDIAALQNGESVTKEFKNRVVVASVSTD